MLNDRQDLTATLLRPHSARGATGAAAELGVRGGGPREPALGAGRRGGKVVIGASGSGGRAGGKDDAGGKVRRNNGAGGKDGAGGTVWRHQWRWRHNCARLKKLGR
eukprot:gene15680-biopygen1590